MRNTRFIAGIIAFIGTFAVSVGLIWLIFGFPVRTTDNYSHHNCSQRHSNAIYSHIQRDIRNGRERDARSFQTSNWEEDGESNYSIEKHANSVAGYVDDSRNLDVSDLPQNFQAAWQRHVNAWHDYSEFLNESKDASGNAKTKNRINKDSFELLQSRYTDEINRTWHEVLRIGRNYGANVE